MFKKLVELVVLPEKAIAAAVIEIVQAVADE